jgi:hypothetical protein
MPANLIKHWYCKIILIKDVFANIEKSYKLLANKPNCQILKNNYESTYLLGLDTLRGKLYLTELTTLLVFLDHPIIKDSQKLTNQSNDRFFAKLLAS